MQDRCEVYIDAYMASTGSCFMVTWIIFKNRLLKIGLTQNWETMALRNLITVDFLFILSCVRTHMNKKLLTYCLVEGLVIYDFTLDLRVREHATCFWKCLRKAFGHFFWALTISWHGSWLVCKVASRTLKFHQCCARYGM
jgi:hypothetical protein